MSDRLYSTRTIPKDDVSPDSILDTFKEALHGLATNAEVRIFPLALDWSDLTVTTRHEKTLDDALVISVSAPVL